MGRRRNGEGSIWRRKDGRWQAALTDDQGSRRYIVGREFEEVRRRLTQLLQQRDAGIMLPRNGLTFGDYLEQWLQDIAQPAIRPSTYRSYRTDINRIIPILGHLRLEDLKPAALQAAYGQLSRTGLAPRSVVRVHVAVHRALRMAVQYELVVRNVADIARPPRAPRIEFRTLSIPEVRQLFEASESHRLHALWVVLTTTGMRVGEALGLSWSDVDLDLGRIQIRRALQRRYGAGFTFTEPKTNRSRRTVMIPSGTVRALREHSRRQHLERVAAGADWDGTYDLVFMTAKGRPLEHGLVHWTLQQTLRNAGLPRIRVHDLRHTAASVLLERGVHPKIVQEMLGHSTITLTLDTYSHTIPSLQAATAAEMQKLFRAGEADLSDDR